MNAIEYFKSYGLSEAKRILRDARGCASVRLYDKYNFSTDDLKQIVDAFELIEKVGGLSKSKEILENKPKGASKYGIGGWYLKLARYVYEYNIHQKIWMQNGKHKEYSGRWESSDYLSDIKKAINLVEQCNA